MKITKNIVNFFPNFYSKKTEPIKKDIAFKLKHLNKTQRISISINKNTLKNILVKRELLVGYSKEEEKALHRMFEIVACTLKDMERIHCHANRTIKA